MMTWRYGLIKTKADGTGDSDWYAVHEVYLDDKGKVHSWTEQPIAAVAESQAEVVKELERMLADVKQYEPTEEPKMTSPEQIEELEGILKVVELWKMHTPRGTFEFGFEAGKEPDVTETKPFWMKDFKRTWDSPSEPVTCEFTISDEKYVQDAMDFLLKEVSNE